MNESQPKRDHKASMSQRERVDRICDEFESKWKAGQKPRIEDEVADVHESMHDLLLRELVALELTLRVAGGEDVEQSEYAGRFAGSGSIVVSAFESFRSRKPADQSLDSTLRMPGERHASSTAKSPDTPDSIGRYEILRVLGQGGFATVYLARDRDLDREVALKVPRLDRFDNEADLELFVDEARKAAQLDYPGIVRIHDVQREPDRVYIVQQFLPGGDLTKYVSQERVSPRQAAELMVEIAEAVGHAHQLRYIHLDLKPANILLDSEGKPHVADFGLALHESRQAEMKGAILGTFAYMSPAQVRGETHRLDGRADIWSLGVIFYELLTGQRPFRAKTRNELADEIQHAEPRPPRQLDPQVPRELSRICLVCLSKRATDRYSAAADLVDDLRHWLDKGDNRSASENAGDYDAVGGAGKVAKIIPQGLRSFGPEHADFYLQLLPGPHDRDGLPPRIRFWKTQIETVDPDETFSVGLIYGPSGCGKSSLVKAGLLPRLAENVVPIYVEATAQDTEVRLLKALRKRCPEMDENLSLSDMVARLRTQGGSRGRKVLIVLDQFEQWLHANEAQLETQLLDALRQCDGVGAQCVLMVRDDFWMSATRLMQALEVPLVEGFNTAAVDLFDTNHAEKVLAAFGAAYERLPQPPAEPTSEQVDFLKQAVEALANDGKVICVQLAVFAEMMKGRPWTVDSLREVGGAAGVGVAFLEETFSSRAAPITHRQHQQAAGAVLRAMLPDQGTDIKAEMKSYDELLEASGYGQRPEAFESLLAILDGEVRLITPTEPDEASGLDIESADEDRARYFQLTHDFLVPSMRQWLTRKQGETRRGRAELRLAERAALWRVKPENRFLPSWREYLNIRLLTQRKQWTEPQTRMMRRAGRVHGLRWAAGLTVVALLLFAGVTIRNRVLADQARIRKENEIAQRETKARGLVDALIKSDIGQVGSLIEQFDGPLREIADPLLREMHNETEPLSDDRLRATLALLPVDASLTAELQEHLLAADPAEAPVIVAQLAEAKQGEKLAPSLWKIVNDKQETGARRIRAACGLATFDPENPDWETAGQAVAKELVGVRPAYVSYWQTSLRGAGKWLAGPLALACRDDKLGPTERSLATDLVADYAADSPEVLSEVIQYASAEQFAVFYPLLEKQADQATDTLVRLVHAEPERSWKDPPLEDWEPVVPTAITTIEKAHGLIAERFAFCQTLPLADFEPLCEQLKPSGYRPRRVRLFRQTDTALVAVVWARDGADWRWLIGDAETIRRRDQELAQQQFQAIDVTAFFSQSSDNERPPQFAALWLKTAKDAARNQLLVGATDAQYEAAAKMLDAGGFKRRLCWSVLPQEGGMQLFSGVWSKAEVEQATYAQAGNKYSGELHLGLLQTDVQLTPSAKLDRQFTALWELSSEFESRELHGLGPAEQLAQARQLIAKGFRPACFAGIGIDGNIVTASVWQRPLIAQDVKEELAKRQANAAVALLKMKQTEAVWPYLAHRPDPRGRTYLLHRLAPLGVDPEVLIAKLEDDSTEVSIRRALLLSLGELTGDQFPVEFRKALAPRLLDLYKTHPDAGIHAASEWLLRQWGAKESIAEAMAALQETEQARAKREAEAPRGWYVNGQGQTMVVVEGGEFLMGSLSTDPDRNPDELLHRKQIGRRYALSATAVTRAQYRTFQETSEDDGLDLVNHPRIRAVAKTDDSPITGVTWYEAAAYCNWLNEHEGIDKDQWCYERNEAGKFGPEMRLKANYRSLTGYRLPNEAEWEFACRAGATTRRYYGHSDGMLAAYAWFSENAGPRGWPVASKKPNDFGLFDMHGNIWTWCHNRYETYGASTEDGKDTANMEDGVARVLRGGSFNNNAPGVRSAGRFSGYSPGRIPNFGFRPARTLPP